MADDASIGAPDQNELVIALVAAVGTDIGMVAEEIAIELSEYAYESELLRLSSYLAEEFGEDFLRALAHALWTEEDVVGEERAEDLLADALGPGGREWLVSRPEF